jgi:hypothetical protein
MFCDIANVNVQGNGTPVGNQRLIILIKRKQAMYE